MTFPNVKVGGQKTWAAEREVERKKHQEHKRE
jgi:hypothetical protein